MPPKRDEAALQEEEELQLAIALSQSEAEEKERMVGGTNHCLLSLYRWITERMNTALAIAEAEEFLCSVSQS